MEKVRENTNYKPTVFWAWNGDMRDEEICRSIGQFDAAGIGGVHLHARAGLTLEYLGEEWMRAYATTIRECKARGMDIWIYDEQGWPSGFAGGKVNAFGEDYLLKYLCKSDKYDEAFSSRLLAAYRLTESGYVRTEDKAHADLYIYYAVQEHYVDLLNPDVCRQFIRCTHEEYKKRFASEFGKTIKGVFTDEPQIHVSSRAWSVAIPDAYRARYNEDVRDGLYLLFESQGEAYQEFRYKYYAVVRGLFVNNYIRKLYEWCEENGLILTGHFAGEEGICVQVASNTGVMPHYEYMHDPGIDHLGRRLNPVLLLKQIQSVANQFSKKRILSETFACTGNGVSFRDLAKIWNYQSMFGVNFPCMSISMYRLGGIRKRDYPVFLSPQQPWWEAFASFNNFMTNADVFASEGEYKADVMVLSAVNGALCEPICSQKQKVISAAYRRLVESMVALQIPFEIGDETLLSEHGRAEGGVLSLGQSAYRLLILPETSNIARSTLELICAFMKTGGRAVCMTRYPERVDGKLCDDAKDALAACGVELIQQRKGILAKYFDRIGYRRKLRAVGADGKLCEGVLLTYKDTGDGYSVCLMNPSSDAVRHVWLRTAGRGEFYRVNISDLSEKAMPCTDFSGETALQVSLFPGQCARMRYKRDVRETCSSERGEERVLPLRLRALADNALTLDKARYRLGDGEFSPLVPLVRVTDAIYAEAERIGGLVPLTLRYEFCCEKLPAKLLLAAETELAKSVRVNGREIPIETDKRFLDMDFRLYDIAEYAAEGLNAVEISYEIRPLHLGFDLNSVHDSVRNRFSYPVAIESVYLTGDFSVRSAAETVSELGFVRTAGDFTLCPREEYHGGGDLTVRGNWFYPGNAEYCGEFEWTGGRVYLRLRYSGTAVAVRVNGRAAGTDFLAGEEVELTPFLVRGKNVLEMTLYGSIRNLLGPHHHCKGEPEYTGVHTFTGEYGNGAVEDLTVEEMPDRVWNDSYAFIRFGVDEAILICQK